MSKIGSILQRNVINILGKTHPNVRSVVSQASEKQREAWKMAAWQIHCYGGLEELNHTTGARIPFINSPDEVLVKVDAASVNPLDVAMIKGYGSTVFNAMRRNENVEFPLTLGRDFAGTVEWKGCGVDERLPVGTKVWGVVPPHIQGSHAEYTVVNKSWLSPLPNLISAIEASGVLYAGLTAWSGLMLASGASLESLRERRVLVLGAAGGVGSTVVQILRACNAYVVCSCSPDAYKLVENLGADIILDRLSPEYDKTLLEFGPYDIIMDCAGLGSDMATNKDWKFKKYITFTTPLLSNTDNLGLVVGTLNSAVNFICPNVSTVQKGGVVLWSYFVPSQQGICYLLNLVENGKLRPITDKVYDFKDLPEAYEHVSKGHLRGKVIINITGQPVHS